MLAATRPQVTQAELLRGYLDSPARFFRDVLKLDPWSRQREIIEAPLTHKRVAVTSGHKISKSTNIAGLALWFYCCVPEVRVVITATTDLQVNGIAWREIKRLVKRAKRAGWTIPYGDEIHELAHSGLVNRGDLSEIKGYTAKDSEAIAGVSGPAIVYFVDEASGVKQHIFEAIEGNMAGGNAWLFLFSNPTRADGENYDAHHKKSLAKAGEEHGYWTAQIDSREGPNCTGEWRQMQDWDWDAKEWRPRTTPVPGLATPEWAARLVALHGEDSAIVAIRVRGDFVVAEEAKAFPAGLLIEAQARYEETLPEGRLSIGVDSAGAGPDPSGFACRRGNKILAVTKHAKLTPEGHCAVVDDLIAQWGTAGEPPDVIVDSDGETGARVYKALRAHLLAHPGRFRLVRFRGSEKPIVQPSPYGTNRDALYASARDWMRRGGAIPADEALTQELHAPEFKLDHASRLKLTPKEGKDGLRALLGHSPDLADAMCLACWERSQSRASAVSAAEGDARTVDAYRMADAQDATRTFSPYG